MLGRVIFKVQDLYKYNLRNRAFVPLSYPDLHHGLFLSSPPSVSFNSLPLWLKQPKFRGYYCVLSSAGTAHFKPVPLLSGLFFSAP